MTMHIFMPKTALMDWLILVMSGSIMTKVEGKYMKEAMVNKIAVTTYSWSMSCHMFVKYVNDMRLRGFSFLFVKVHIFWEGHKILQNSTVDLSYVVPFISTVEILQNFVAFSEYVNFIMQSSGINQAGW